MLDAHAHVMQVKLCKANTRGVTYVNQNSGVRIEALDGLGRKIQYFGIIEEIWELDYGRDITVALFRSAIYICMDEWWWFLQFLVLLP